MTMGSAPKANKGPIHIPWLEVFGPPSHGAGDDDVDVCFLSSPSAAGKGKAKGNAFARSSTGVRDDEGFVSPPPAPAKGKGKGKGRRYGDAEAELSPRSNDGLRWDIANMSDSELQCEIQNACSTHPSFGRLLEQEKRNRRERLLPLLKAEARYRGIDRDAAKVRDYRNRDDSSDAKRFCMFDFDDLEEEQVPSKFIRRSSPIRSTKKHYGTLGVVTRQRVPIPVDKMYASKTSLTTLYSHKQRVRAVDPKEHDNEKHQQIGNSHHSNYTMRRKERQGVSSLSLSRKGNNVVLLDDEDVQPDESVHCGVPDKWRKSKIYYPSRDDPEAVELNGSDFRCLDPGVYLSSPVINYYIQHIKRTKLCSEDDRDKFYMFNTYFYNKLREALFGKGDFLKLRRWWKGINIFQRGYIILPIHGTAHWSLVIICIPAKESNSGPIILHLDSLGMHPSDEIFDTVKRYLVEEWHHLRKNPPSAISISEKIWDELPMNIHKEIVEVPAQNNAYDCGIFMLYYIKQFIRDAPERFTRKNIDMFSRSWFRSEVVSGFRNRIRELLLKEFENAGVDDVMLEAATSDGSDAECIIKEGESEAVTPCGSPEMGADAVMLEAATSDCFDEECIRRKGKLEAATACDSLEMFGGGGDTMEGTSYVMTGECVLSEEATLSGSVKDDKDTMKADSHSSGSDEDVEILPSDRSKNNEEVRHRAPDVDILRCCDSDAVDTGVETNNEDVTRRAHSSGSEEDVEILPSDRSKNNEEVRHRAPDVEILCCDDSCDSDADDTAAETNNEDVMRRAAGVGTFYCEDSCDSDTEGPAAARKWRSKNNKEAMEVEKGGGRLDLCQIS